MSGLGTESVRWIACDDRQRIDMSALRAQVQEDIDRGDQPFLVVGAAGTVSTGAIDPLRELAEFCREQGLWFHVDGAYGGLAAGVPGAPEELQGLALADSVAVDPHKWLYAPIEAGCALVRDRSRLLNAFSYRPPYYNFDTESINYFDLGAAELARVPCVENMAGIPAGGAVGIPADDCRRYCVGRARVPPVRRASRIRGDHTKSEHLHVPICPFRSRN